RSATAGARGRAREARRGDPRRLQSSAIGSNCRAAAQHARAFAGSSHHAASALVSASGGCTQTASMIRSRRIKIVHVLLAVFALAVIGQAAHVQLLQGHAWRVRAARQQLAPRETPAPRGEILDAAGLVLAQGRVPVPLEVAPREVRPQDRATLRRALMRVKLRPEWIRRAFDTSRAWLTLPGRYLTTDVASATRIRGVHPSAASVRANAMP